MWICDEETITIHKIRIELEYLKLMSMWRWVVIHIPVVIVWFSHLIYVNEYMEFEMGYFLAPYSLALG